MKILPGHIDEDAWDILRVAADRMDILLKDRAHLHHKSDEAAQHKVPLIQRKQEILGKLLPGPEHGRPFEVGSNALAARCAGPSSGRRLTSLVSKANPAGQEDPLRDHPRSHASTGWCASRRASFAPRQGVLAVHGLQELYQLYPCKMQ